jgi:hypothetical protein
MLEPQELAVGSIMSKSQTPTSPKPDFIQQKTLFLYPSNPPKSTSVFGRSLRSTLAYAIEILIILISSSGFSLYTLVFSILCTTSMPEIARPKIVCLSSSQDYITISKRLSNFSIPSFGYV